MVVHILLNLVLQSHCVQDHHKVPGVRKINYKIESFQKIKFKLPQVFQLLSANAHNQYCHVLLKVQP